MSEVVRASAWGQPSVGAFWSLLRRSPAGPGRAGIASSHPSPLPDGIHAAVVGRLDNREELARELLQPAARRASADSALIASAYVRWGDECARRVLGDFSFVLIDEPRRRLVAARDVFGVKPLYYAELESGVIVGTALRPMRAALCGREALDREFLEAVLAGDDSCWQTRTPFSAIRRVPPAHALVASPEGCRVRRYYALEPVLGESATEDDHLQRFAELFRRSVLRRLDPAGSTAIFVSGGLDSSAVACQAGALVDADVARGPLRLYSSVFTASPRADERAYFEAVVRRCPHAAATALQSDDCVILGEFGDDHGFALDEPEIGFNRTMLMRRVRAAATDGSRVVLSGVWGDQVLIGQPYHQPSLWWDVPMSRRRRELLHFREARRRSAIRTLLDVTLSHIRDVALSWFGPSPSVSPAGGRAARLSQRYLSGGESAAWLAQFAAFGEFGGVDFAFPFLDRPLVEFLLGLPSQMRFRDGVTKYVLRQGLAGVLAPEVSARTTHSVHGDFVVDGPARMADRIERWLRGSVVAALGLMSRTAVEARWREYQRHRTLPTARALVRLLAVEVWLRRHLDAPQVVRLDGSRIVRV